MADLTVAEIESILRRAEDFFLGTLHQAQHQTFVSNLFFENSTRTRVSFEVAQRRLGLEPLNIPIEASSMRKAETLLDTILTLQSLGVKAVVIRHHQDAYYEELKGHIGIPVLNAGDGCGQHPTQCLLDLLTMKQEFGDFVALKVAIAGDIRHSRVARSHWETLARLGAQVTFVCPDVWRPEDNANMQFASIDDVLPEVDVLMLLRVQHERHGKATEGFMPEYLEKYGLTPEREQRMKPHAIIMHPAPVNRGVEIADELVTCERSRIFRQMENGVYVRMAVMERALPHAFKEV